LTQEVEEVAVLRGILRGSTEQSNPQHYFMACLLEAARVGRSLVAIPTEEGFLDNAGECWRIESSK
jgi:hypothetical protein